MDRTFQRITATVKRNKQAFNQHVPSICDFTKQSFSTALSKLRKMSEIDYHEALLDYVPPRAARQKQQENLGIWYTDAHLLSRRSNGAELVHGLHTEIPKCGYCVSLGDKWDFAWSIFRSIKKSVEKAAAWEIALAKRYPNCHFDIVAGNHDDNDLYVSKLKEASAQLPNLSVHRHVLKRGTTLFTHGDCVRWPNATLQDLLSYRETFNSDWLPNLMLRILDECSSKFRLNRLVPEYFFEKILSKKTQAERILNFIKNVDATLLEGVTEICFGHTHNAFQRFEHQGYFFTNGGAHERGFQTTLHRFSVDSDWSGQGRSVIQDNWLGETDKWAA